MSMSQHHDDPAAEGATRAAQLAAMALSLAEGVARLQAERLAATAAQDERRAAALRAQQRSDLAAAWLAGRGPAQPSEMDAAMARADPPQAPPAAPAPAGDVHFTIVCTPRDLADQAFPVPVTEAMATASRRAGDAVRLAAAPSARPRAQLTSGSSPTPGRGGAAR